MESTAVASWQTNVTPCGAISTRSAALAYVPYAERSDGFGNTTDPNELLAAAHAACFVATLAGELSSLGLTTQTITATSTITRRLLTDGMAALQVTLDVVATVPGAAPGDFISAAVRAKLHCPICRLFHTDIAMNARLKH